MSAPPPDSSDDSDPPSSEEEDRAAILLRRNRFIASAVAGLAALGIEGCDPPPKTSPTTDRDETQSTSVLTATDPTTTEEVPRPSVCLSPVMIEPDAGAEPDAVDAGFAADAGGAGIDAGVDGGPDAGAPDAGKPPTPPGPCLSPPLPTKPRPCLKIAPPPKPCLNMKEM